MTRMQKKEYIKKIGNKYVFFYGEEKCEEFETLKEVENYLYDSKINELRMINHRLSILDENYFHTRVSILYKNLTKKDDIDMSLELKEWIKKYIKISIEFRNTTLAQFLGYDVNSTVGNYLYLSLKDYNYYWNYDRIDIKTL